MTPCSYRDCASHECLDCGRVRPHQDLMPDCPCKVRMFEAQPVDRRRCVCGIQRRLHHEDGRCPDLYRPPTLESAQRALERAEASGDEARIFVARGEVQRLGGRALV